ncbi:uncharacterized protein [Physcomitrium patens]|uniref:uncharacterized protein n=1 Tax=Physcomitrium patens TaxID=3218 RepID=UPI003CCD1546
MDAGRISGRTAGVRGNSGPRPHSSASLLLFLFCDPVKELQEFRSVSFTGVCGYECSSLSRGSAVVQHLLLLFGDLRGAWELEDLVFFPGVFFWRSNCEELQQLGLEKYCC